MNSALEAPVRPFRPAFWRDWDTLDPLWRQTFLDGPYQDHPEDFTRRLEWSTEALSIPVFRQRQEAAWPVWWAQMDWQARLPETVRTAVEDVPFSPCLEPLAATAVQDFPAHLQAGLATGLLEELSAWSHRGFYAAFDIYRKERQSRSASGDHFTAFLTDWLTGGPCHPARQMPGLTRLLALLCVQWRDNMRRFLDRLARDEPEAAVASVSSSGADRHDGGAKVLTVVLTNGQKLIYKPRSVQAEASFHDWLGRQNLLAPEDAPPALAVRCREDEHGLYGWMEFAESTAGLAPGAADRYHRRAGTLLFLMHLLGASDLHMENVIATAGGPVVVDLECLLQPTPWHGSAASPATGAAPADLPGRTGLLPARTRYPSGEWVDISGYGGRGGYQAPGGKRRYICLHRGLMNWKTVPIREPDSPNRPAQEPWDYAPAICQGYQLAHDAAQSKPDSLRTLIQQLAAVPLRWLLRPTTEYGAVLRELTEPDRLTHLRSHAAACETLAAAWTRTTSRPAAWPVLDRELPDLDQYDVPVFQTTGASCGLFKANTCIVPACFAESGHAAAIRRLESLGGAFCEAALREISSRLTPPPGASALAGSTPARDTPLTDLILQAAGGMAEAVRQRMELVQGRHRWPETIVSPHDPAGISLYGGTLGTAVFLAAAGRLTQDKNCLQAAEQLGQEALSAQHGQPIPSLGACVGAGSVVLGFSNLAYLTGDDSFSGAALRTALAVTLSQPREDRELDLLGGLAGWTGVLTDLYRHHRGIELRAALEAALTELLARREQGIWLDQNGQPLAGGLAHGAAGPALVISRAALLLEKPELSLTVQDILEQEAAGFDPVLGNWPLRHAVHGRRVGMNAYCNGAAGMMAAVSEITRTHGKPSLNQAPWAAAWRLLLKGSPSGCDHVCCGNAGRLAMVQSATRGTEALQDPARRLARLWLQQQRLSLDEGAPPAHAGFFRGLSGIGHVLLRIAFPDQIPDLFMLHSRPENSTP